MNIQADHTYPIRTASVGTICLISVAQAGTIQFGDRAETNGRIRALALQRQQDHTTSGDVFFESYPLFYRPLPSFSESEESAEQFLSVIRVNCSPNITVGHIQVIAAGSSASIQIGNGMQLRGESRIKHIRQYPRPRPVPPLGC
ncbi:spore germination protein GerPE [Paenibacillus sinopodophylli]|uniref:spore germination protein GerPE n=1 Tax=Paenibacillus sinopodophylli TaxID=1837342 RepID=UPI00110CD94D|nr:spore germination protein GerPE [Paenibacillus sinopodophylli]